MRAKISESYTVARPPRVFISYSHDSAEHKRWVLEFASTLRNRGADAVLDQWDLRPGDDLPHFMETELERCDFALMICSERYVEKANAGEGGVGYEKMIMTASLLKNIDDSKVIPIVRQSSSAELPTFMRSKIYIDFSKDDEVEYKLDELLRHLLNTPLYEKPEIGSNPFKSFSGSSPDRASDGIKSVMTAVAAAFEESGSNRLPVKVILNRANMHRLTLDRYLYDAVTQELLEQNVSGWYSVTRKGIEYLVNHGIIDA